MARTGSCSECGKPLNHVAAKTCGVKCRSARARRIKRAQVASGRDAALPAHQKALSAAVRKEVRDDLHEVAKEELRPVVREAITEDVLRAVQKLVGLTPRMVDLIEADLGSSDDTVRQRAYTLLAKYTLGNAAVAPAAEDPAQAGMTVVFAMPRPGSDLADVVPADAHELRECVECKESKPVTDFIGQSERCSTCHQELQALVAERLAQ